MKGDVNDKKDDRYWKEKLTPEQYRILREKGTEEPFSGELSDNKEKGTYYCAACGEPLFSSEDKFDSGTGWPSFTKPVSEESIDEEEDNSLPFQPRVEVKCSKCGGHLGHVFDDLPEHAGQAGGSKEDGGACYCINSCSLDFKGK